jgi:hypothetical protein
VICKVVTSPFHLQLTIPWEDVRDNSLEGVTDIDPGMEALGHLPEKLPGAAEKRQTLSPECPWDHLFCQHGPDKGICLAYGFFHLFYEVGNI